jgi:hypothetical protein
MDDQPRTQHALPHSSTTLFFLRDSTRLRWQADCCASRHSALRVLIGFRQKCKIQFVIISAGSAPPPRNTLRPISTMRGSSNSTVNVSTAKDTRSHRGADRCLHEEVVFSGSRCCATRIFEIEFRFVDSISAMKVRSASSRELAEEAHEASLTRVGRIQFRQQRDRCLGAGCQWRTCSLLARS